MVSYLRLVQVHQPISHSTDHNLSHPKSGSTETLLPGRSAITRSIRALPIRGHGANWPTEFVQEGAWSYEDLKGARRSQEEGMIEAWQGNDWTLGGVTQCQQERWLRTEEWAKGQREQRLKQQGENPVVIPRPRMSTSSVGVIARYTVRLESGRWERVEGGEVCTRCKRLDIGCYLPLRRGNPGGVSCLGCYNSQAECSPLRVASHPNLGSMQPLDDVSVAFLDAFLVAPVPSSETVIEGDVLNALTPQNPAVPTVASMPVPSLTCCDGAATGVTRDGSSSAGPPLANAVADNVTLTPLAKWDDLSPPFPCPHSEPPVEVHLETSNSSVRFQTSKESWHVHPASTLGVGESLQAYLPCQSDETSPAVFNDRPWAASSNKRGGDSLPPDEVDLQRNVNSWGSLLTTTPLVLAAPKPSRLLRVREVEMAILPEFTKRRRLHMDSGSHRTPSL